MRIGLDLDGCIYDFTASFLSYVGLPYAPATCWAFYESHGYSTEEFLSAFANGVDDGHIFITGEPLPDSVETMHRLKDAGHSLHIVTDRFIGNMSHANTSEWLARCKVPYDSLTFSRDKTIARVSTFLDDKPSNVDDLRAAGIEAFLLDCDRTDQVGHPWLTSSWAEFEDFVAHIARETE